MRTAQAASAAGALATEGTREEERASREVVPKLPTLAYLIRMFPQTSETFIANEVLEIERLGGRISIFSYRRPREEVTHECVRLIRAPLTYLPDPLYRHARQLARDAWAVRRREPARFRRAFAYALRHSIRERDADVWRRLVQAACLSRILLRGEVAHLHAHFAHQNTQVAMLASVMTGIPFSFSAHAKDIYTAKPRALREKIRAATFVATCTRANQDYLRRMADPDRRARIHLSYHGTNITKFQPSEATPKDDPPLILSAGRLVPKKGLPYLLRACGVLARSSREFRCVIVGEGPERGALEHEAARLGLGDLVSFRGRASQEELLGLYRRAAIFALPCTVLADGDRDGIPNVLMEAMAVELPVVSTAISGIPELIRSGHNGVLVPERDVDGLAGALERLLADATLRRRLGENARATVLEKFNSAANARSLAELFARNGAP